MLDQPKSLAPEPFLSAYVELIYHVTIFVRLYSEGDRRLPDAQLFDLMDALHNIPEMLLEYDSPGYDENDIRRLFLEAYDAKWAKQEDQFSLVAVLDDALRRVAIRDTQSNSG